MKNKLFATAVVTPAILFSTLLISQNTLADSVKVNKDGGLEISITANRRAQSIDKTLASVTVITRKDIEQYKATRLEDVLKRVPGITIKGSGGGDGKLTSVFMRGTNSNHVLVLIDGIEVGSAPLDSVPFEHYPIEQIERIEIVRGPRSSLYGARAIGGVINIITRSGEKNSHQNYTAGLGSNNTGMVAISIANRRKNNWFSFNASGKKSKGIDVLAASEPDKDGYKRRSIGLNLGHEFNNGSIGKITFLNIQGNTKYDGYFKESDFKQRVISGTISGKISNTTQVTGKLGTSLDDLESFNSTGSSVYTTRKNSASIIADTAINPNINFVYGIDLNNSKVSGTSTYTKNTRKNQAAFVSIQGQKGYKSIEASLRNDKNKQFGSHTTGGLSLGYELPNGAKLIGSYATAFKVPSYYDLYDTYSGNKDLSPESSETFEVGISKHNVKGNWAIKAFQTKVADLISYDYNPLTYVTTIENTDKVLLEGIEGELNTKLGLWSLNTNITLLNPKNKSGANKGKTLFYRSKQVATLDLSRNLGKLNLGTTLHAESKKYTNPSNTDHLAGFATLDLRADYQISKAWKIGAKIGNVLDKKYQINKGYNQEGTNGFLTISYSPK